MTLTANVSLFAVCLATPSLSSKLRHQRFLPLILFRKPFQRCVLCGVLLLRPLVRR